MLSEGDKRLLHDAATLIDRGLEHAEAVLHQQRQRDEADGHHEPRTYQALESLAHVRGITRR